MARLEAIRVGAGHPGAPRPLVTALGAASTLIVGFGVAEATGARWPGGLVLVVGAGWAARRWARTAGRVRAVALVALGALAFGVSHPLGKVVGAWPAVVIVSAVAFGAALALDRRG